MLNTRATFSSRVMAVENEHGMSWYNVNSNSNYVTKNGKTYFYDQTKAYKYNGVGICFFNHNGKATNFRQRNLIKINKKSMRTKLSELFGRIEVGQVGI